MEKRIQDMPPQGGYPRTTDKRRLPRKGVPGIVLFGILASTMTYGFYKVVKHNLQVRKEREEMRTAYYNLIPLLQAEQDRIFLRERKKKLMEEKEVMKDVEDWKVGESVYKTRWMKPRWN